MKPAFYQKAHAGKAYAGQSPSFKLGDWPSILTLAWELGEPTLRWLSQAPKPRQPSTNTPAFLPGLACSNPPTVMSGDWA
jgi:hypothetical protein